MKLIKKIIPSAIAASLLVSFSACGGGGDSTTPTATPLSSITTSGTAADGYISGGTACLDLSLDGVCQSASEPTTTTSGTGTFSLNVTAAHQTHANYDVAPVIVYGGTDIDTNKPYTGTMKAPYSGASAIVVSPLTTMVQALIDNGETEADAKAAVAAALNIPVDDVLKDPVVTATITKAALSVQKSVELLAQANVAAGTSTSNTEAFSTVYSQIADATVAVSNDAGATKSFTSVVAKAKTDGTLLGGAASSSDTVTVIENAITTSTLTGSELALVTESQLEEIKAVITTNSGVVTEAEAQTAADGAEDNPRVLTVTQILESVNATSTQITTVLALGDIVTLTDIANTTTITNQLVATAIANSYDTTITDLAIALGETPKADLSGEITTNTTLTADTVWVLNGLVS
ncbi:MAG: hypothetical protein JXQ67_10155, partial [Campylobacterales bacterium]|nr:hypothetical protein [Campylobacterales bacterium]